MAIVMKRRANQLPVNLLTALAGGVITALGVIVAPVAMLEALVALFGLPAVLAAAAPPLGFTARIMIAAVAFVIAAMAVGTTMSLLTTLLNRKPRRKARPFASHAVVDDEDAPALRRADSHPDAPPRRPIFAGSDLGTPFQDVKATVDPIDADDPFELDTLELEAVAEEIIPPVALVKPVSVPEPVVPEPLVLAPLASVADEAAEPAFNPNSRRSRILAAKVDPVPIAAAEPEPEPQLIMQRPSRLPVWPPVEAPVEATVPAPTAALPAMAPRPAASAPQAVPAMPAPQPGRESVADLIQRLEDGLQRRAARYRQQSAPVAPARPVFAEPAFDEDADAALRDALGSLRRMATRAR